MLFRLLGLFPQDFGKVKEWLILELHKIKIVLHEVAFRIVYICFMSEVDDDSQTYESSVACAESFICFSIVFLFAVASQSFVPEIYSRYFTTALGAKVIGFLAISIVLLFTFVGYGFRFSKQASTLAVQVQTS